MGFGKKWWLGNGIGSPPSGPSVIGRLNTSALEKNGGWEMGLVAYLQDPL